MSILQHELDKVVELDAQGKTQEALDIITKQNLSPEALSQVAATFYSKGSIIALVIAREILGLGLNHWFLHVVNYHLSALDMMPSDGEAAKSIEWLKDYFSNNSSDERTECANLLRARMAQEVVHGVKEKKFSQVKHLLELCRILMPKELAAFNCNSQTEPWNFLEIKNRSNADGLIKFPELPADTTRTPGKAVVVSRKYYYFHGNSRLSDIGPRIKSCLEGKGWMIEFYGTANPIAHDAINQNFRDIHNLCLQMRPELLILEEVYVGPEHNSASLEVIRDLRMQIPGIKIVSTYLDAWNTETWPGMRSALEFLDGVWCPNPSLPLWQEPIFSDKVLLFPLPHFSPHEWPGHQVSNEMSFCGGLAIVNWHRGLWLAAFSEAGIHVNIDTTTHLADGLSPNESYRNYISKIQSFVPNLNFSSRYDGTKVHTGRTFEIPLAGALLIEEANPETGFYFTPGEHFLPFSDVDDLIAISQFIRNEPEEVEAVRKRGYAFAEQRYGDAAIASYFDCWLSRIK